MPRQKTFTAFQKNLEDIARVFESNAAVAIMNANVGVDATGSADDAQIYFGALSTIQRDANFNVIAGLEGASFRPFFLMNGLICLSSLRPQYRRNISLVLSTGLRANAAYFYRLAHEDEGSNSEADEKKYFAFLMAYLPKAGMDFLGIMMTMKGDCTFQQSGRAISAILEGNSSALVNSSLFTAEEKQILTQLTRTNATHSWAEFSNHLVREYRLPPVVLDLVF